MAEDHRNNLLEENKRLIAAYSEQIKVREKAEQENKRLIDSNRELIGALNSVVTNLEQSRNTHLYCYDDAKTAINNAKAIL